MHGRCSRRSSTCNLCGYRLLLFSLQGSASHALCACCVPPSFAQLHDWGFNVFSVDKHTGGHALYHLVMSLLEHHGLFVSVCFAR